MAGLDAWATHRHGYRNHDTPDGSRKSLVVLAPFPGARGGTTTTHANPSGVELPGAVVGVGPGGGGGVGHLVGVEGGRARRLAIGERPSDAEPQRPRWEGPVSDTVAGCPDWRMSPRAGVIDMAIPWAGRGRSSMLRLWVLATVCVVQFVPSWSADAMADMRLAMSRKPPPDPIQLQRPALSPDGTQAALAVSFHEGPSVSGAVRHRAGRAAGGRQA